MRTPEFMIDTANLDDIEKVWEKLVKAGVSTDSLFGITTNPNALSKINCNTIKEFETTVYQLTRFLTRVGAKNATVHVQMPQSRMSANELEVWIGYIRTLGDGVTKLSLKVSPYATTLGTLTHIGAYDAIDVNVTGVADAATAYRVLMSRIKYVSIIPGRMEEVGIDASAHLRFINQRPVYDNKIVITGSMRTVEGLRRAIDNYSIPTIGTRVWDLMTDDDYKALVDTWWNTGDTAPADYLTDIPIIDQRNIDLTQQFFTQMDTLGKPLYDEFVTGLCK